MCMTEFNNSPLFRDNTKKYKICCLVVNLKKKKKSNNVQRLIKSNVKIWRPRRKNGYCIKHPRLSHGVFNYIARYIILFPRIFNFRYVYYIFNFVIMKCFIETKHLPTSYRNTLNTFHLKHKLNFLNIYYIYLFYTVL